MEALKIAVERADAPISFDGSVVEIGLFADGIVEIKHSRLGSLNIYATCLWLSPFPSAKRHSCGTTAEERLRVPCVVTVDTLTSSEKVQTVAPLFRSSCVLHFKCTATESYIHTYLRVQDVSRLNDNFIFTDTRAARPEISCWKFVSS